MNTLTASLRALTALAAGTLAATMAAAPAAATGPIVAQSFSASSSDGCGVTSGTLGWHTGPGVLASTVVDVDGSLVDHPLLTDPVTKCRDLRYSVATFTAYQGKLVVDTDAKKADDERATFRFQLTGSPAGSSPIDLVVIQVCRVDASGTGLPDVCGKPVEFRPPITPAA